MNGPRPWIEDGGPGPHGEALATLDTGLTTACTAAILVTGGAVVLPRVATVLTTVACRGLLWCAPSARAPAPATPCFRLCKRMGRERGLGGDKGGQHGRLMLHG